MARRLVRLFWRPHGTPNSRSFISRPRSLSQRFRDQPRWDVGSKADRRQLRPLTARVMERALQAKARPAKERKGRATKPSKQHTSLGRSWSWSRALLMAKRYVTGITWEERNATTNVDEFTFVGFEDVASNTRPINTRIGTTADSGIRHSLTTWTAVSSLRTAENRPDRFHRRNLKLPNSELFTFLQAIAEEQM